MIAHHAALNGRRLETGGSRGEFTVRGFRSSAVAKGRAVVSLSAGDQALIIKGATPGCQRQPAPKPINLKLTTSVAASSLPP